MISFPNPTEQDKDTPQILFFYQDIEPCIADATREGRYREWLVHVARAEGKEIGQIQVVFLSDDALLELNQEFLDHDYYTDILTFPLEADPLVADLYISIDRIRDNARSMGIEESRELARVMVHGILHLCGYGDKDGEEARQMRERENDCLALLERWEKARSGRR